VELPIKFDHFSQKQKVVLLVCVAVIFLGIGIGLTAPKKTVPPPSLFSSSGLTNLLPTAEPTPFPALFTLEPTSKTLKVGESLSLALTLNSGAFTIDAVDAILNFDPAVLKAEKITPGKIFSQYPIKQIDNKKGKVQLSAAAEIKNGKVVSFSGEGEYGSVTFRTLKATDSAQIVFDINSIVASAGKNVLDLKESKGGNYIIK